MGKILFPLNCQLTKWTLSWPCHLVYLECYDTRARFGMSRVISGHNAYLLTFAIQEQKLLTDFMNTYIFDQFDDLF